MNNTPTKNEVPTFTVNDIDGTLKEGILHCFLSSILLDTANPPSTIRGNNGTLYQAVYDNFALPSTGSNKIIPAIASFQAWPHGNFVIIRNKKD